MFKEKLLIDELFTALCQSLCNCGVQQRVVNIINIRMHSINCPYYLRAKGLFFDYKEIKIKWEKELIRKHLPNLQ